MAMTNIEVVRAGQILPGHCAVRSKTAKKLRYMGPLVGLMLEVGDVVFVSPVDFAWFISYLPLANFTMH